MGQHHETNLLHIAILFYLLNLAVGSSAVIKVVTNLEGQFICQVGSSEEGLLDGPFDAALFNRPQVRNHDCLLHVQ